MGAGSYECHPQSALLLEGSTQVKQAGRPWHIPENLLSDYALRGIEAIGLEEEGERRNAGSNDREIGVAGREDGGIGRKVRGKRKK